MSFAVGNTVSWKTHGSVAYTRVGKVIKTIPANTNPTWAHYASTHNFKSVSGASTRGHVSYLVEVISKGKRSRPLLYWPRVEALSLVMDTSGVAALNAALSAPNRAETESAGV